MAQGENAGIVDAGEFWTDWACSGGQEEFVVMEVFHVFAMSHGDAFFCAVDRQHLAVDPDVDIKTLSHTLRRLDQKL